MIRAHVAVLECSILQLRGMWYPDLASVGDGEGLVERPEVAGHSVSTVGKQTADSRQEVGPCYQTSRLPSSDSLLPIGSPF